MDHYIEITLKPDAEMRENRLLNMVFTKLHRALCDLTTNAIGVSFPGYQLKMGNRIRIHGDAASLGQLQVLDWLGALVGYCDVIEVRKVPGGVQHRTISRKQSNMTNAKLNRLIKRGAITTEQIHRYKAKMFAHGLDNPYLELESSSNGNKHRRYIEFGELQVQPVSGQFDCFGLSKQATVPWF